MHLGPEPKPQDAFMADALNAIIGMKKDTMFFFAFLS